MKKRIVAVAVLGLLASTAQAAGAGLSAELGSTGYGLHLAVPLAKHLNARIGVNAFNYSYDGSTDSVNYDYKLKLNTVDALLDFYPSAGVFRISAGVVYNGNKITVRGKPTAGGTFTLNGVTYAATDVGTLDGKIDFRKTSPYLGIGWGNALAGSERGFAFSGDLGVLFQGSPRTSLTNSNCGASASVCAEIASNARAESERLKEEGKDFKTYPVIRFGVTYRF